MKQFKTPIYRRRHGCRKCPLLGGFVFWGTLRNIEYYDTLDVINILVNKNYRWIGNPTHSLFLLCIKMRFLCLRTRPQPGAYNEEENNAFKWTKFLERQLNLRTFAWYLVPYLFWNEGNTCDRRFWSKSCSQNSKGCMPLYYIYANGTQCTHYIQTYLAGLADYNFSYYHMFLHRQFDPSRDNDIKTKVRMTHCKFKTFLFVTATWPWSATQRF